MKKKIILTGPSGCGKTGMIREVLGGSIAFAGGFITEKTVNGQGQLTGHELLPAAAAAGIMGFKGSMFMDMSGTAPVTDNEVFRKEGVRLLNEAQMYTYGVLDEFGGFELIIPQFREALLDVLNSPLPCVGVLMDAQSAGALRSRLGLGQRYTDYRNALEAALSRDEDTVLLRVDRADDAKAMNILRSWCAQYVL